MTPGCDSLDDAAARLKEKAYESSKDTIEESGQVTPRAGRSMMVSGKKAAQQNGMKVAGQHRQQAARARVRRSSQRGR